MTQVTPKMKNEPKDSYNRLQYKLSHNIKTLAELRDSLKGDVEVGHLAVGLTKLAKESSKWEWVRREKEYKENMEIELQEEIEEIYKELNTLSIHEMKDFLENLHDLRVDVMKRFGNKDITSSYALKSLTDYSKCYNEATDIYYTNSRHKREPETETLKQQEVDENRIDNLILNAKTMDENIDLLRKLMGDDEKQ